MYQSTNIQTATKPGFWHWFLKLLYLVIWFVFLANFYIYLFGDAGSKIAGVSIWGIIVFNFIFINLVARLRNQKIIDNQDILYGILLRTLGITLISFSWTNFSQLKIIFLNSILGFIFFFLYFKLFAQTPLKKSLNWIYYLLACGSVIWAILYQLR